MIAHFVPQNREKIIRNGQHIMENDPRRRFTFGVTIENTSTRLWYFSRSHIMVTEPFNFNAVRL